MQKKYIAYSNTCYNKYRSFGLFW